MPFKSKAQMRYMFSQHPEIANRWEKEHKQTGKGLPARKKKPTMANHKRAKHLAALRNY